MYDLTIAKFLAPLGFDMATHDVILQSDLLWQRRDCLADVTKTALASGVEGASRRRIDWRRNLAAQYDCIMLRANSQWQRCRQKGLGGPCAGAAGERLGRLPAGDRQGQEFPGLQGHDPAGLTVASLAAGERNRRLVP